VAQVAALASVILVVLSAQPQFKKGFVFTTAALAALLLRISPSSCTEGAEHRENSRMLPMAKRPNNEFFILVVIVLVIRLNGL